MAELGELEKIRERLEAGERVVAVAQNSDIKKFALAVRKINKEQVQEKSDTRPKIIQWFFKSEEKSKKEKIICDELTFSNIVARIRQVADRKENALQNSLREAILILNEAGFFLQSQAIVISKEIEDRLCVSAKPSGWHGRNIFEANQKEENNVLYRELINILRLLENRGLARQVDGKYRVKNEEYQFVEKRGIFQTRFDVENGQDVEIKMDQADIEKKIKEYKGLLKAVRVSNENDPRHQNPVFKFYNIMSDLVLNRKEMFAERQNNKGEKIIEDKVGKRKYFFTQEGSVYELRDGKDWRLSSQEQLLENIDYYAKMARDLFESEEKRAVGFGGHSPQVLLVKMKQQLCDLASKDKMAINMADKKTYLPSDPEIDIGKDWSVRVMLLNSSQVVFSVKSPDSQPIHFKFGKSAKDDDFNQRLLERLAGRNLTSTDLDILSLESVARGANANVGNNFYVVPTVGDLEEFVAKLTLANKPNPSIKALKSASEHLINKTTNLSAKAFA